MNKGLVLLWTPTVMIAEKAADMIKADRGTTVQPRAIRAA